MKIQPRSDSAEIGGRSHAWCEWSQQNENRLWNFHNARHRSVRRLG